MGQKGPRIKKSEPTPFSFFFKSLNFTPQFLNASVFFHPQLAVQTRVELPGPRTYEPSSLL